MDGRGDKAQHITLTRGPLPGEVVGKKAATSSSVAVPARGKGKTAAACRGGLLAAKLRRRSPLMSKRNLVPVRIHLQVSHSQRQVFRMLM